MVLVLQCSTLCDHCSLCFVSLFLDKNSNARGASKKFWMQKAQLNWVFLTWSLCFIALLFVTIVLWFLFSLFLGFALHNIHASHSRLFLFSFYKIKKDKKIKKRKKEANYVFVLSSWFLKTRLVNLFSCNMSLYLI